MKYRGTLAAAAAALSFSVLASEASAAEPVCKPAGIADTSAHETRLLTEAENLLRENGHVPSERLAFATAENVTVCWANDLTRSLGEYDINTNRLTVADLSANDIAHIRTLANDSTLTDDDIRIAYAAYVLAHEYTHVLLERGPLNLGRFTTLSLTERDPVPLTTDSALALRTLSEVAGNLGSADFALAQAAHGNRLAIIVGEHFFGSLFTRYISMAEADPAARTSGQAGAALLSGLTGSSAYMNGYVDSSIRDGGRALIFNRGAQRQELNYETLSAIVREPESGADILAFFRTNNGHGDIDLAIILTPNQRQALTQFRASEAQLIQSPAP